MPQTLTLHCPAKLNLQLAVGPPLGPDSDQPGMHPIASWMVALGFGDTLTLRRAGGGSDPPRDEAYDIAFADDAPLPGTVDWPLDRDLAYRAHQLMEEHASRRLPVTVTVRKRVPTGAGLGGGSGNAGAMLVGLNDLFELGWSTPALAELGAALGSDVPFAVQSVALDGWRSCRVWGLGDRIEPMPAALGPQPPRPLHFALVLPELHCPTSAVYAAFDDALAQAPGNRGPVGGAVGDASAGLLRRLDADLSAGPGPFNDLAQAAMRVEPRLGELYRRIHGELGLVGHVTGSGAALFVLMPDAAGAREAAERIASATGVVCIATAAL